MFACFRVLFAFFLAEYGKSGFSMFHRGKKFTIYAVSLGAVRLRAYGNKLPIVILAKMFHKLSDN